MSIEEAHARLETHIRTPRWRFYEMPMVKPPSPTETIVPLAGAELERRLAALLAVAGHREPVERLVQRLLQRDPEDATAWEMSAIAQIDRAEPSEATIAGLAKALRRGSRNPYVPLALGHVAIERNLREETGRSAGELFALALEFRPGMPEAYEGAARLVLARDGEVAPPLQQLVAEGLRRSPSSVELNLATAWLERASGQPALAVTRLSRMLEEHPELPVEFRLQTQNVIASFKRAALSGSNVSSASESRDRP